MANEGPLIQEFLATTSVKQVTRNPKSRGFEIVNYGPNPIWAAIGLASACVPGKCRRIDTGSFWSVRTDGSVPLFIRAAVADQLENAATVIIETTG